MIDSFQGKYRFLSNFYGSPLWYKGLLFPSSEHAYQAMKTEDKNVQSLFTNPLMTAGQAKRLGRKVKLRDKWDEMKAAIMLDIVEAKFRSSEHLADKLIDTEDQELVEGNTWGDTFFGVCDGTGENWLGRILMEVRRKLKDERRNDS